ncbi:MAG: DUF1854 domain-containing protein [Planctomycetia bacterium]|nr:DUF1854 domain-containing protein [Planctomycetia bacterium]
MEKTLGAIELSHDPYGRLVLVDGGGRRHVGVETIRAFPLSEPHRWISICNAEGVEVLWIEDLNSAPAAARELIVEDLARREFMPVIDKVIHVSGQSDPSQWEVQTDRGTTRFLLKGDDDVRRIGPRGAMLIDSSGMRYLVPDLRRLDAASRRTLERYL